MLDLLWCLGTGLPKRAILLKSQRLRSLSQFLVEAAYHLRTKQACTRQWLNQLLQGVSKDRIDIGYVPKDTVSFGLLNSKIQLLSYQLQRHECQPVIVSYTSHIEEKGVVQE